MIPQSQARVLWDTNANALYLYCTRKPMTTDYPVIHHADKQFRPEKLYFPDECADWLTPG